MTHYAGKDGAGGRPKKKSTGTASQRPGQTAFFSPSLRFVAVGLVDTGQSGSGGLCFLGQARKAKPAFVALFFFFRVRFSNASTLYYILFLFVKKFSREGGLVKVRGGEGGERSVCWALDVTKIRISPSFFMVGSLYLRSLEEVFASFYLAIKSIRSFSSSWAHAFPSN